MGTRDRATRSPNCQWQFALPFDEWISSQAAIFKNKLKLLLLNYGWIISKFFNKLALIHFAKK
jgi:hypothetical protein